MSSPTGPSVMMGAGGGDIVIVMTTIAQPINTIHSLGRGLGRLVGPAPAMHGWRGHPGYMCCFVCSARWSEREKALSHRWHCNGRCRNGSGKVSGLCACAGAP
jgi:hypothetical protein